MYCVECGTKNPDDAKFCKQCGRTMELPDAASSPAPPAAAQAPLAEHVVDPEAKYKELLARGIRLFDRGQLEEAREACRDALDLSPDGTDARALLSTIHERLGDIDAAIAERERILQLNPASIADREKLDALKTGITQATSRRIVSARLRPETFWDRPAGAAVAAVGAALIVIAVGYAVLAYRDARTRDLDPNTGTLTAPPQQGQSAAANPTPAMPPSFSGAPATQQPPPQPSSTEASAPAPDVRQPTSPAGTGLGPLPVMPQQPALETQTSPSSPPSGSSFFDPAPSASNTGTASAAPPASNPGRIEIVVAPQGAGLSDSSPNASSSSAGPRMESNNNAAIARNLQLAGRYKEAAQAWERALAAAGDDAAKFHQSAALSYQRTGDYANARRHYNEAIAAYRDLIAAGKAGDTAEQGIKTCEAGLKVCQ